MDIQSFSYSNTNKNLVLIIDAVLIELGWVFIDVCGILFDEDKFCLDFASIFCILGELFFNVDSFELFIFD